VYDALTEQLQGLGFAIKQFRLRTVAAVVSFIHIRTEACYEVLVTLIFRITSSTPNYMNCLQTDGQFHLIHYRYRSGWHLVVECPR
ncbi:hypothetical protein D9U34_18445, partial [Vibrio anguillarum]